MQINIDNTLFARSAMTLSKQQSADGTCPEDNIKLNRFEIELDAVSLCKIVRSSVILLLPLLPETIAIGSRSIQSEHKAVSN
jgi:hypothetical protein